MSQIPSPLTPNARLLRRLYKRLSRRCNRIWCWIIDRTRADDVGGFFLPLYRPWAHRFQGSLNAAHVAHAVGDADGYGWERIKPEHRRYLDRKARFAS